MRSPEGAPYFWNSFRGAGFGRHWQPFSFPIKNLSSSPDVRNLIMLMNMLNFFIIILGDFLSEMNTVIEVYKTEEEQQQESQIQEDSGFRLTRRQLQLEIEGPIRTAKRTMTELLKLLVQPRRKTTQSPVWGRVGRAGDQDADNHRQDLFDRSE